MKNAIIKYKELIAIIITGIVGCFGFELDNNFLKTITKLFVGILLVYGFAIYFKSVYIYIVFINNVI